MICVSIWLFFVCLSHVDCALEAASVVTWCCGPDVSLNVYTRHRGSLGKGWGKGFHFSEMCLAVTTQGRSSAWERCAVKYALDCCCPLSTGWTHTVMVAVSRDLGDLPCTYLRPRAPWPLLCVSCCVSVGSVPCFFFPFSFLFPLLCALPCITYRIFCLLSHPWFLAKCLTRLSECVTLLTPDALHWPGLGRSG